MVNYDKEEEEELVKELSKSSPGSKDLHFESCFSQSFWGQYKSCLWKQNLSYWRNPSYNLLRLCFAFLTSLIFGLLFWKQGTTIKNQQSLFTILGSMFSGVLLLGINNCNTAIPHIAAERTVFYRERFTGMYSSWAYSAAQFSVELPYLFSVAMIFTVITYPMIGFYLSPYKIFWYFYAMFCTLLYFNYLGMLLVALTPNHGYAAIASSSFNSMANLFAGFLIPQPHIPKWWLWLYYLCPTSWSLNGLLCSQYGDIYTEIKVFGETKTVASFLRDYFGFRHDHLPIVAVVLLMFPLVFASLFAFFMGKLNFQRR